MVDRVYKHSLPELRKALKNLNREFSELDSKTNWTKLRIEPLLKHSESLEQLLESSGFSNEFSRLTRGVEMFHSDLVYFRTNIKSLKYSSPKERH
jgi:molecular chaperone GrpE (heat shock protein)